MTDQPSPRTRDTAIVWWLVAAVITTIVFWVGIGPSGAIVAGVWMFGVAAVLAVGRDRSVSVRAILGVGDERERDLYTRAMAASGTILGLVVTAAWLASVALGVPSDLLFALTMVFSASFFGSAIVLAHLD